MLTPTGQLDFVPGSPKILRLACAGDPKWGHFIKFTDGSEAIALGDFDGDGRPDGVVTTDPDGLSLPWGPEEVSGMPWPPEATGYPEEDDGLLPHPDGGWFELPEGLFELPPVPAGPDIQNYVVPQKDPSTGKIYHVRIAREWAPPASSVLLHFCENVPPCRVCTFWASGTFEAQIVCVETGAVVGELDLPSENSPRWFKTVVKFCPGADPVISR